MIVLKKFLLISLVIGLSLLSSGCTRKSNQTQPVGPSGKVEIFTWRASEFKDLFREFAGEFMTKNKIYLVSFEYFPISQCGLARHATEIINRLLKLNKAFTAVIAVPRNDQINLDKRILKISCIFFKNKYLCYLEFSIKLYLKFFKEYKNKFIFFSSFSYLFNPLLPKKFYLFITNTTKRVFLTDYPEETLLEKFVRKTTYFFLFYWENHMSKKAIKIFAISDSTKKDIINQYKINEDKIKIIPCALNKTIFKSSESFKDCRHNKISWIL